MSPSKLNEFSADDLRKKLATTHAELLNQRLRKCAGQVDDLANLRNMRRNIARMETFLTQKTTSK